MERVIPMAILLKRGFMFARPSVKKEAILNRMFAKLVEVLSGLYRLKMLN